MKVAIKRIVDKLIDFLSSNHKWENQVCKETFRSAILSAIAIFIFLIIIAFLINIFYSSEYIYELERDALAIAGSAIIMSIAIPFLIDKELKKQAKIK